MKKIVVFLFLVFTLNFAFCENPDTLFSNPRTLPEHALFAPKKKESLFQFGFRLGANIPLSKSITENLQAKKSFSAEFCFFARAGKFVFGELGFGYHFHKNTFGILQDSTQFFEDFNDVVELRYLQIPVRAVGKVPLGENVDLLPAVGLLYQPLIHVSKNVLDHGKHNLSKHQLSLTAGIGIKVYFVTLEVAYRHAFQSYFKNEKSLKPSYISILVGFQL